MSKSAEDEGSKAVQYGTTGLILGGLLGGYQGAKVLPRHLRNAVQKDPVGKADLGYELAHMPKGSVQAIGAGMAAPVFAIPAAVGGATVGAIGDVINRKKEEDS